MIQEQLKKHKQNLEKFGFTVIRNCFPTKQIEDYKKIIVEYFSDESGDLTRNLNKNYREGKESTRPLALADKHFDPLHTLFEDNDLMNLLKYLTDDNLIYGHQVDVHVDTVAGKGWHRDSLNNSEGRMAPNWKDLYAKTNFWSQEDDERYQVYRIAIYGQDHIENQDGLFVMANSHSHDPLDRRKVVELYAKTRTGDVVIFDARMYHRGGNANVVKGNHRTAIFFNMGKDNTFTREHVAGAVARQKYQNEMEEYEISDSLKEILERNNIGY